MVAELRAMPSECSITWKSAPPEPGWSVPPELPVMVPTLPRPRSMPPSRRIGLLTCVPSTDKVPPLMMVMPENVFGPERDNVEKLEPALVNPPSPTIAPLKEPPLTVNRAARPGTKRPSSDTVPSPCNWPMASSFPFKSRRARFRIVTKALSAI